MTTPQATSQFEAKKTPRTLLCGHFLGDGGVTLCQERVQGWDGIGKHERLRNNNAERSSCCVNPAPTSAPALGNQPGARRAPGPHLQLEAERESRGESFCCVKCPGVPGNTHCTRSLHVWGCEKLQCGHSQALQLEGAREVPGKLTHFIDEEAENHHGKVKRLAQNLTGS